jgi:hypothetical protein
MGETLSTGKKIARGLATGVAGLAVGAGSVLGYNAANEPPKPAEVVRVVDSETQQNADLMAERERQVNQMVVDVIDQTIQTLQDEGDDAEFRADDDGWYFGNKMQSIENNASAESRVVFSNATGRLTTMGVRQVSEGSFDSYAIVLENPDTQGGEVEDLATIQQLVDTGQFRIANVSGHNTYDETFFVVGGNDSLGGSNLQHITYGNGGYRDVHLIDGSMANAPNNLPEVRIDASNFLEALDVVQTRLDGVSGSVNDAIKYNW